MKKGIKEIVADIFYCAFLRSGSKFYFTMIIALFLVFANDGSFRNIYNCVRISVDDKALAQPYTYTWVCYIYMRKVLYSIFGSLCKLACAGDGSDKVKLPWLVTSARGRVG